MIFLNKPEQTPKRDFENTLNQFSVYKIKTFVEDFWFPNICWNDFQEHLGFWRGVLEFKPFSKLFQTGILDKRCFKIVGMRSLKPFWWKHFANTKAFQDKLFLKPCLLNGVIYKTFEIKGAFLKQVEINASFENKIFWRSLFSKTKHTPFLNDFKSGDFENAI